MRRSDREGYALVGAVAALLVFSLLSLSVLAAARGVLVGASAEIERGRLDAAAEAGALIAIAGLLRTDGQRWSIDGQTRVARFEGMSLAITVEDERGKIPLQLIDQVQARAMFEALGVSGEPLTTAVDSLLDWQDNDNISRAYGAEANDYARSGIRPRNGPMRTISEMLHIRGITPTMVERLRPVSTLYVGATGGFDERYAQPFALRIMRSGGLETTETLQRARERAGQRPELAFDDDTGIVGRPLTVRVVARGTTDSRIVRTSIIELTGSPQRPFVVQRYE